MKRREKLMKKILISFPSFVFTLVLTASLAAQTSPNFDPGQYLLSNGDPILGDKLYSAVSVCDWNDDGKKDLLVGVIQNGNLYLFLNQGTNSDPVFGQGARMEADGIPISVGHG